MRESIDEFESYLLHTFEEKTRTTYIKNLIEKKLVLESLCENTKNILSNSIFQGLKICSVWQGIRDGWLKQMKNEYGKSIFFCDCASQF